jgi:LPXTG-site transpeptidase (sortase) family protein
MVLPPASLRIDALEIDAPVMALGLGPNGVPDVPDDVWTKNTLDASGSIGWYPFTSMPGGGSNSVFIGHLSWGGRPAVFAQLEKLWPGDTVAIVNARGEELVYEVFANFLLDPRDPRSLDVMRVTSEETITLITCGGRWIPNRNERFGGDYSHRRIVQGRPMSAP